MLTVKEKRMKVKELYFKLFHDETLSDEEESEIIYEIDKLSPDPEIGNYIFGKEYENLTIDEIIEKAFSYKPIILGDHSKDEG